MKRAHQNALFLRIIYMTKIILEPPSDLFEKIIKRIHRERRAVIMRKVVIFSGLLAGSIITLIPSIKMLLTDFNESGFIYFFPLLFSDFSTVLTYWQNFILIVLETLPVISLATSLFILLVFLQSLKLLTKNIKIILGKNYLAAA